MTESALLLLALGVVNGFLGATVGGGGMLSVPAMIALGIPPLSALANAKMGDLLIFLIAVPRYLKANKINPRLALAFAALACAPAALGAVAALSINPTQLERLIGFIIIIFLPLALFSGALKKRINNSPKKPAKPANKLPWWRIGMGGALYALVCVISGMTNTGGGATMLLLIIMAFFGLDLVRGYATNTPACLMLSIIPAAVFLLGGWLPTAATWLFVLGSGVGTLLGLSLALSRFGVAALRPILAIVALLLALKLLW